MCCSARSASRRGTGGFTLVELALVIVVSGIVFATVPVLIFHGVKTLVFLPKALAVNEAATEVLHQVVEGGFSILAGQTTVRGLRFAVRRSSTEPALWLAEASRIGFRTSDGQTVLVRLDSSVLNQEAVKRSLPAPSCTPTLGTEEVIPYHAQGSVRILPIVRLFRYYVQSGLEVNNPSSCPPPATIRRVDIAFTAQTGSGNFDQGDAREDIISSVAIRVP
ncbi:MAG: hypothetical protein Q8R78_07620 [Candidatus Omnitrophota bacterium]|nr:hypothetical protein [Candidatus Omnitrophota bacterium]